MKLTKDRLKQIIKEELEEMMGQESAQGDVNLGSELYNLANQLRTAPVNMVNHFLDVMKGNEKNISNPQVIQAIKSLVGRYSLANNPEAQQYLMASIDLAHKAGKR
jgi:hypothetical protein